MLAVWMATAYCPTPLAAVWLQSLPVRERFRGEHTSTRDSSIQGATAAPRPLPLIWRWLWVFVPVRACLYAWLSINNHVLILSELDGSGSICAGGSLDSDAACLVYGSPRRHLQLATCALVSNQHATCTRTPPNDSLAVAVLFKC